MKPISVETLMLTIFLSLIVGLVAGFIVRKGITERPIIVIDTSSEAILDKACEFHGIGKADYIIYSGHSFMRDGKRCSLFNNGFRSKYASDYNRALTEKEIDELYKQGPPK